MDQQMEIKEKRPKSITIGAVIYSPAHNGFLANKHGLGDKDGPSLPMLKLKEDGVYGTLNAYVKDLKLPIGDTEPSHILTKKDHSGRNMIQFIGITLSLLSKDPLPDLGEQYGWYQFNGIIHRDERAAMFFYTELLRNDIYLPPYLIER